VELLRSGGVVTTMFDLLGHDEDHMTYGLGFVASRSECFLKLLVERLAGASLDRCRDAVIRLQTTTKDGDGRTDVEIEIPTERFAAVLEAKRGSVLPAPAQLRKYIPVLKATKARTRFLVAVTNTPADSVRRRLGETLDGIPLRHISWREMRKLAEKARDRETHKNKHLLEEFCTYLEGVLGMEKLRSNMVYVVSLSRDSAWNVPFMDVVLKHRRYFYPTEGGGWPEPPNYIAFRYDGRLQSIHHVDSYEIFEKPRLLFPEAENVAVRPHYCLKLGPAFGPAEIVKAGPKILRNIRVWCMIDTLMTCNTITEARDETKRRLQEQ
jgi:hypothetical protein